jgi:hypothetical protein
MIWFRKTTGIDSEIMRQAAENAGVSWSCQAIMYKKQGIGFKNGDASDAVKIQDELEKRLGYRPVEIDEPSVDTDTDQTQ